MNVQFYYLLVVITLGTFMKIKNMYKNCGIKNLALRMVYSTVKILCIMMVYILDFYKTCTISLRHFGDMKKIGMLAQKRSEKYKKTQSWIGYEKFPFGLEFCLLSAHFTLMSLDLFFFVEPTDSGLISQ